MKYAYATHDAETTISRNMNARKQHIPLPTTNRRNKALLCILTLTALMHLLGVLRAFSITFNPHASHPTTPEHTTAELI